MKRRISLFLALLLLFCLCTTTAAAVDTSRAYEFDLTINGSHEVRAKPGDILTVMLTLRRTDSSESADMYAMQDEIRYDGGFLELVDGGSITMQGIETTDLALLDGDRAFYMNFLSLSGGEKWLPSVLVGTFQIRVLGEKGSTVMRNENCSVSVRNGSDSYSLTVQDLRIIVSSDCTVTYDPMDGSPAREEEATLGALLQKPDDPTRAGYVFTGWYKDPELREAWDFDRDTVEGNMTLYAGWRTADTVSPDKSGSFPWWALLLGLIGLLLIFLLLSSRKTVTFETNGGTKLKKLRVRKGDTIERPEAPKKPGADFVGWYKDEKCMKRWDFDEDTVEKNLTLYAKWH